MRAYDGVHSVAHSILSNAVNVLVDSTAQTAPRALTRGDADGRGAGALLAGAADVRRRPLRHLPRRPAAGLDDDARRRRTPTAPPPRACTTTRCSRAAPAPGRRALGVLQGALRPDAADERRRADRATILTNGSVSLAWPAAGDALSGVAGYVVRRAAGATPPAAADAGAAVCAPATTSCVDAGGADRHLVVQLLRPRRRRQRRAHRHRRAASCIVDRTAPLAPTKLKVTRAKAKTPAHDHHRDAALGQADGARPRPRRRRAQPQARAEDSRRRQVRLQGLGTSAKVKLQARAQTATSRSTPTTTAGNVSTKPARTVVKLAALIPLRPLNGSDVRTASPLLTWKAFKGTTYYNVQRLRERQAHPRRLALEGLLPHPAGQAQAGHLRLVRVARDRRQGRARRSSAS